MGQVILSLEEYDELKKSSERMAAVRDCLKLDRDYAGNVELVINIKSAKEIFETLLENSEYKDTHTLVEDTYPGETYTIASYYLKAVKNESLEEAKEAVVLEPPTEV